MSITLIIIIITGIASYLAFKDQGLFARLCHWPYKESKNGEYLRFLTSGFIHGSWLHLLINMIVFYSFGGFIEEAFYSLFGTVRGAVYYIVLYIAAIIIGNIPSYIKHRNNQNYRAIGASGAVSAIVFVFIVFNPWAPLYLYGILPIPGIVAGVLYLAYSSWASRNSSDNVDHDAHFYGALAGILILLIYKSSFAVHFYNSFLENAPW